MSNTITDTRFSQLRAAGYTGTLTDMEYQRLLNKVDPVIDPRNKVYPSFADLSRLANERIGSGGLLTAQVNRYTREYNEAINPIPRANSTLKTYNATVTYTDKTTSDGPAGVNSLLVTFTSNATNISGIWMAPNTPDGASLMRIPRTNTLGASVYVKSSKATRLLLSIYSDDYDYASSTAINVEQQVAAGVWTRLVGTSALSPKAFWLQVTLVSKTGTGYVPWVTGDTLEVQGFIVGENNIHLDVPWNGSTPNAGNIEYLWEGTPNESRSIRKTLAA